jgi:CotH protein.
MNNRRKYTIQTALLLIICVALMLAVYVFSVSLLNNEEDYNRPSPNDYIAEDKTIILPKAPNRAPTAEEAEKYPQLTNIPTLYITLDDDVKMSKINKESSLPATYTLVISEEEGIYDQPMEIKGRGNYSWGQPKKPYNLKLAERTDLLGMGMGRSWVLITTYSDKTLLRNYLTLNLAINVGLEYSPECRFVDVYMNGDYVGNYLMTEKIQLNKDRINVNDKIGGLFEIEVAWRHGGQCPYCIDVPSGVHIMYIDGDEEKLGAELKTQKLAEFTEIFTRADIAMKNGYEEYSQCIDVPSFIDWYIVNEFVKNFDSGFTTSCYCYVKADGKIYMGPVWDYDTCMGNQDAATCMIPTGYHVSSSPWFSTLTSDPDFIRLLEERWTQLIDEGTFLNFQQDIIDTVEYLAESEKADHKKWRNALKESGLRGRKSIFTYVGEVEYLQDWTQKRTKWLSKQWYIGHKTRSEIETAIDFFKPASAED